MKKITFGLSVDEIQKAQQEIRQYQAELVIKTELFVKMLATTGVTIAKAKIVEKEAIYTGELLNSISSYGTTNVYYIISDCPWAVYVEFGTGVIGKKNPHPNPGIANWKYDINNHGEKGWSYFKDGKWHWTKGMPSRPYMLETAMELENRIVEIGKTVFGS